MTTRTKKIRRKGVPVVDSSQARSNIDVLRLCLHDLRWKECIAGSSAKIDIHWNSATFHDGSRNYAATSARINKFPGMCDILCKSSLTRALNNMRMLFPDEFDFYPRSWFLPEQRREFEDDAREIHKKDRQHRRPLTIFIVKPSDGSEGAGIYLIQDPTRCSTMNRAHIVQEYVARPLLLNGLKFDVRIYVLILSLDPLEILLYDEGLARFATVAYQAPSTTNLHETFMHLTNYSLNKRSATYKHAQNEEQTDASKRKLSLVWTQLLQLFTPADIERAKERIKDMINKTVLAIVPELRVQYAMELPTGRPQNRCFQIIGFDILLTDRLKPILLEVNANPSLRIDYDHVNETGKLVHDPSPIDEEIKKPLVSETLELVMYASLPLHRQQQRQQRSVSRSSSCSSDEADEDTSRSLDVIYPPSSDLSYESMLLLEKVAFIYIELVLKHGYKAMTNRPFRQLASMCDIIDQATPMSAIDILYIQIFSKCKHYESQSPATGLLFPAFVDAFFQLARRKYPDSNSLLESVTNLIDTCTRRLHSDSC